MARSVPCGAAGVGSLVLGRWGERAYRRSRGDSRIQGIGFVLLVVRPVSCSNQLKAELLVEPNRLDVSLKNPRARPERSEAALAVALRVGCASAVASAGAQSLVVRVAVEAHH